jgi:hypothetical protein
MEAQLRVWGPVARRWPRLGRLWGIVVVDGEPRFAERVGRGWSPFVRFIGIGGVLVAVALIVQGLGKLH